MKKKVEILFKKEKIFFNKNKIDISLAILIKKNLKLLFYKFLN